MTEHPRLEIPGLLMRLVECSSSPRNPPPMPCPNIENIYAAAADDGKTPTQLTLYFVSDVRPLIASPNLYDNDLASQIPNDNLTWVVCSYINGRDKDLSPTTPSVPHLLSHTPAAGSRLVVNGSSPRQDKEEDYHNWYNEEHGPMLSLVPGWNENKRYRLEKSYGDVETASFYGFNFYDVENGLGGPEWKASTDTEWTQRVRSNHAKPNIRRMWKIQHP
jgi:hypothetical protein